MASILGLNDSTYGAIERNERQVNFENIVNYAEILKVPVQEFLPELTSISNNHNQGTASASIVFGNINYYASNDDTLNQLQKENEMLKQENQLQKDQINILTQQLQTTLNLLEKLSVK